MFWTLDTNTSIDTWCEPVNTSNRAENGKRLIRENKVVSSKSRFFAYSSCQLSGRRNLPFEVGLLALYNVSVCNREESWHFSSRSINFLKMLAVGKIIFRKGRTLLPQITVTCMSVSKSFTDFIPPNSPDQGTWQWLFRTLWCCIPVWVMNC